MPASFLTRRPARKTEPPRVLRMSLRATRLVPALHLAAGKNLRLTFTMVPNIGLMVVCDGCQPESIRTDKMRRVAAAARDGGLVYAEPPSTDELMRFMDAYWTHLEARITARFAAR